MAQRSCQNPECGNPVPDHHVLPYCKKSCRRKAERLAAMTAEERLKREHRLTEQRLREMKRAGIPGTGVFPWDFKDED